MALRFLPSLGAVLLLLPALTATAEVLQSSSWHHSTVAGIPIISSPVSYRPFSPADMEHFRRVTNAQVNGDLPHSSPPHLPSLTVVVGIRRHHFPPSPPPPSKPSPGPTYHGGRTLAGGVIEVHLIWYGRWGRRSRAIIRSFISSIGLPRVGGSENQVPQWWGITRSYPNKQLKPVSAQLRLGRQHFDRRCRFGKQLNTSVSQLVVRSALQRFGGSLPLDSNAMYALLTAADVKQQGFCTQRCGYHDFLRPPTTALPKQPASGQAIAFTWVGNPAAQCPGFCGFPFAAPSFIPPEFAKIVKPPSGNLGLDASIIVLAHELAGMATNPFFSGWFAGSALQPQEISDFCLSIFGPGAFPGDPGQVLVTAAGAGYNTVGANGRKFLLPWLWDLRVGACAGKL